MAVFKTAGEEDRRMMINEAFVQSATAHQMAGGMAAERGRGETSAAKGVPVRVALLADCLATFRLDVLKKVAAARAIEVDGVASTLSDLNDMDWSATDLVILFPWTYNALRPLWDLTAILDEAARVERLAALKDYLTAMVGAAAAKAGGRPVLVQGLAGPPLLPHGRNDLRSKMSYRRILFEINDHICEMIRDRPNMFFVDEERLFANLGRKQLLAYASSFFSQYVGSAYQPGKTQPDLLAGPLIVTAREYLDIFTMWSGRGRIKCIVTDLDNTLWPGEIGEGALRTDVIELAMSHYGGLHEALKLMKKRGILLATCSKNTADNVLGPWAELAGAVKAQGFDHFLEPDDFVIHRINWERKSDNLRAIRSALGFKADALLFIDDHPVEREEVKQSLPEVTVLDSQSAATRYEILSDPRLETVALTEEAQSRTEMTRAQLCREAERRASLDEQSFLRSLRIRVRVTLDRTESRLGRVVELIQRTNQFNTTQTRHDAGALRGLLSSHDAELYTMEVTDKFTDYGVVGACLIRAGEIDTFVLSCRVLGLKLETAFLVSAVRFSRWAAGEVRGRIIETQFNQPCRQLFLQAGFTRDDEGWYVCRQSQGLAAIDPTIHEVDVREAR
jgi:FkbH-like protein